MPGVKSKAPHHFKSVANTRVAIDISCLLHAYVSKPKNALSMCCSPPYAPTDVVTSLDFHHNILKLYNIVPYYVFDGYRHPMKSATNLERSNKRKEARKLLDLFYERGKDPDVELTDEDHTKAMKYIKTIASPTNEMISLVRCWLDDNKINHMCSPFDAEWQCVHLEQVNEVDAIMSTDGDCIILGAKKVYYNVNFNNHTFNLYDIEIEVKEKELNPLFKYDVDKWSLIASLLGCDYVDRIKNVGYATIFNKILPKLVDWSPNEVMIVINSTLKIVLSVSCSIMIHS